MFLMFLLVSVSACVDREREGVCKSVAECVSSVWTYGTVEVPLCDVPGSDYKDDSTKVCCFG